MAGTLVKSVMLKITASDGDTEAKLDAISAKAKELAAQHPDLQVRVDSAAAMAKLTVLRREMRATADDADGSSTSLGARLRGLGTATASITGVGDAMTLASKDSSMFQKVMAGASLATGLLEPALAGGIVAAAGLGSGLVAAGVGGGIFGLALKGVITDVTTADKANVKLKGSMGEVQSSINHVETEYSRWIGSSASGIESVLAPALRLVPAALSDATQFLGPVEAALQDVIIDVKSAMGSPFWTSTISEWAATSGPMIEDIAVAIGHVIHGVVGILDAFMPMSTSLGAGLDSLTEKFAKWGETISSHTGFQSLISMAKTEAPMAISVLKNLATVLLNVGKAMTGMDGVGNSKMLLQVLQPLSGVLASLSKNQDLDRIALYLLAGADAGKKLSNTFQGISSGLTTIKSSASGLKSAANAVKDFGLGSKIASAATKVWTGIQAAFDVVMAANPIVLVTIAIIALVAIIVLAYIHFKTFRDIVNDVGRALKTGFLDAVHAVEVAAVALASFVVSAWNGIKTDTTSIWNGIKQTVSTVVNAIVTGVKTAFNAVVGAVTAAWDAVKSATSAAWSAILSLVNTEVTGVKNTLAWFANLGSLFRGWWNSGLSAVESVTGTMTSFVSSIPGKIVSALGNLGSLLINAGKSIIEGLISGIEGAVPGLRSALSDISSLIPSWKGPPGKDKTLLYGNGQLIMQGLNSGIQAELPKLHSLLGGVTDSIHTSVGAGSAAVAASAQRMASAATTAASGGTAGAGGAQQIQLNIQGSDQNLTNALLLALRKNIRTSFGGNVQAALGH